MLEASLWLALALAALVPLQRWIHRHLQGVWLLVFRHADIAMMIYALIMLPGVFLHEGSHWLMAALLGVRTGRFSVIPARLPNGTLRLGYVEAARADPLRESIIGAAPFAAGVAAILFVGFERLGLVPVGAAWAARDAEAVWVAVLAMPQQPDFWLWLYLVFTVANAMLPSSSDRRGWWPVLAGAAAFAVGIVALGLTTAVMEAVTEPITAGLRAVAAAVTVTVVLDLLVAPAIGLAEAALVRVTHYRVEY